MNRIISKLFTLAVFTWIAIGVATPAHAQDGGGSKTVVIIKLLPPSGPGGHAVEATKIDVNEAGTKVTVTIRDPECPNKTSTLEVDVASQKVTDHTGDKCHSYKDWKVGGITRIKKKKDADAVDATGG